MKFILIILFFTFNIHAQEVKIILTQINQKDSIQCINFQDKIYLLVPDTIIVDLKNEYANFGIMTFKLKKGFLLCDFSSFYGLKATPKEPVEFSIYKLDENIFRANVYNKRGEDIFWDCSFISELNVRKKRK